MGCLLTDLFLLMLLGVLTEETKLMVQQVEQIKVDLGSKVNMDCQVTWTYWQQFRVEWKKDGKELYQSLPISQNSNQVIWSSRNKLVRRQNNTITLSLDDVNVNDSGHYVCHVKMEIPELQTAEGNGTHLIVSDFLLWLLVACVVIGLGAVLGTMIWRCFRRSTDSESHFYGNVLYFHKRTKGVTPSKDKPLQWSPEKKRGESIYSAGPQPPPLPPRIVPSHSSLHQAGS
ncbi:transmembrane and immunoglobulin domain-containing protein 2 isoform X2 [Sminthopsis crassicaudata]|uniref:transmembrane and immunoglobulin domain-containing protein 2 isoform X2 n=1 Tax=Sminthopsis crassicaudata TaxID=9301 RepID=UPI003D692951